jgi:hypothetical protein
MRNGTFVSMVGRSPLELGQLLDQALRNLAVEDVVQLAITRDGGVSAALAVVRAPAGQIIALNAGGPVGAYPPPR